MSVQSSVSSRSPVVPPGADALTDRAYVEWAPIFAGAVVAAAIALALTTFGSALGLAIVSPYPSSGASGKAAAIAAALYAVWIMASASIAGGYLAGRLRHRTFDATEHESEIRNGAHGLVVWAVAALIVGTVASFAAGSGAHGTWMSSGSSNTSDLVNQSADSLLRSDRVPNDTLHRQVTPLLEKAGMGRTLTPDENSFLARATAAQTGGTAAEAQTRVTATVTALRDEVDTARKYAIMAAFVAAASLAIGAAAAWWAATLGGKHRDEGIRMPMLGGF